MTTWDLKTAAAESRGGSWMQVVVPEEPSWFVASWASLQKGKPFSYGALLILPSELFEFVLILPGFLGEIWC